MSPIKVAATDYRLSALTKQELFAEMGRETPPELSSDQISLIKVAKDGLGRIYLVVTGHPSGEFSLWRVAPQDGTTQSLGNAHPLEDQ